MNIKTFTSSILYLLILISLWGTVEMVIELVTKNVLLPKIIIYIGIFITTTAIYVFVLNNELNLNEKIEKK